MDAAALVTLALLQVAVPRCAATPLYLAAPSVEVLYPGAPAPVPFASLPGPDICALTPLIAAALSSSLAATLPPILEAALPTVVTSSLAATAPFVTTPCAHTSPCSYPLPPVVLPACPSCAQTTAVVLSAPSYAPAPVVLPAPCSAPVVLPAPCSAPVVLPAPCSAPVVLPAPCSPPVTYAVSPAPCSCGQAPVTYGCSSPTCIYL